jgi:hypothetical protein
MDREPVKIDGHKYSLSGEILYKVKWRNFLTSAYEPAKNINDKVLIRRYNIEQRGKRAGNA